MVLRELLDKGKFRYLKALNNKPVMVMDLFGSSLAHGCTFTTEAG